MEQDCKTNRYYCIHLFTCEVDISIKPFDKLLKVYTTKRFSVDQTKNHSILLPTLNGINWLKVAG